MKIIHLRLVLTLCFGITTAFAYPQQWQIAKHAGGAWFDGASTLAIDSNNNTYIGGKYSYGATFDSQYIECNGYWDFFLAKYQANGDLVWVKHGGGTGNTFDDLDEISEIKIHDQTQLYVGGIFTNQVTLGNSTLNSMGDYEAFVARFDSAGDCIWARSIGGVGRETIQGLDLDADGNIYITGYSNYSPTIFFDTTYSLTMNGHLFFMAKYDPDGHILWTKSIEGTGGLIIFDITHFNNNFCLSGSYHGNITFDSVNLSTNKAHLPCIFVVDTAGQVLWGQSFEPKQTGNMNSSCHTASGYLYCIGYAVDSLIIGADTLSDEGGFLLKMDESGDPKWMRRIGNSTNIAVSSTEKILVTATEYGTQIFDDCVAIPATTNHTLFIASIDSAGECEGVVQVPNVLWVNQSVFDANDRFFIAGKCIATEFGNITVGNYGDADAFWAALDWVNGEEENNHRPEGELYIYANPNTGVFQLVVPEEARHEVSLTLNIYDNSGKVIHSQVLDMSEDPLKVDVSPAKAGMYHIQLISSRKTYSGKLVVY